MQDYIRIMNTTGGQIEDSEMLSDFKLKEIDEDQLNNYVPLNPWRDPARYGGGCWSNDPDYTETETSDSPDCGHNSTH